MRDALMDVICCPVDKATLEITVEEREGDEILAGVLACSDCGERYPIEDGIPNLLPPDMRESDDA